MPPPTDPIAEKISAQAAGNKRYREGNAEAEPNKKIQPHNTTTREFYRGRPLTIVETHFSRHERIHYCSKVMVKKGKHVQKELTLPTHFRLVRYTREKWGMAKHKTSDSSRWCEAYLYNVDKATPALKGLKEYLHNTQKSAFGFFRVPGSLEEGVVVFPFDQPPIPEGLASTESDEDHLVFVRYTYDQEIISREKENGVKHEGTTASARGAENVEGQILKKAERVVQPCHDQKISSKPNSNHGEKRLSDPHNTEPDSSNVAAAPKVLDEVSIEQLVMIHGNSVIINSLFQIHENDCNI